MALWQYSFQLIPKSAELTTGDTFLNREITANLDFWHGVQFSTVDITEIELILPLTKSWSDDLLLFGNSDSSCLAFLVEKGAILESELKIDLRSDFSTTLERLRSSRFMRNVFLLDESGYVLTIDNSAIIPRMIKSKHYNTYKDFFLE